MAATSGRLAPAQLAPAARRRCKLSPPPPPPEAPNWASQQQRRRPTRAQTSDHHCDDDCYPYCCLERTGQRNCPLRAALCRPKRIEINEMLDESSRSRPIAVRSLFGRKLNCDNGDNCAALTCATKQHSDCATNTDKIATSKGPTKTVKRNNHNNNSNHNNTLVSKLYCKSQRPLALAATTVIMIISTSLLLPMGASAQLQSASSQPGKCRTIVDQVARGAPVAARRPSLVSAAAN